MGFLSRLFSNDPWAKMPQSVQIVMRRRLSADEFDQLTALLRKHGEVRKAFPGLEHPQLPDEEITASIAGILGIVANFETFTESERELLVNLSLKFKPEKNSVWPLKAYIHVRQGRFEEAQNAARQALKILKVNKLETLEFDDPELTQAVSKKVAEINADMRQPNDFDQDAADYQHEAALEGIVRGRYNLLYFKTHVDARTYELMRQLVAGVLQQRGVRLSSETDVEQQGLDPDFQCGLAITAVNSAKGLLSESDKDIAFLAYQAAYRFDEFNFDAHHALAVFMHHVVPNADEPDPEAAAHATVQQACFHAETALKLLQIPQVRYKITHIEEKKAKLEEILRAHPQS